MRADISINVEYKNEDYLIVKYDYNLQYFSYYNARQRLLRESLEKSAAATWPTIPIHQLSELADKKDEDDENFDEGSQTSSIAEDILQGKELVVIGTLFKKMPKQPNILKELDDEKNEKKLNVNEADQSKFVSDEDIIYLQAGDESIELKGGIKISQLCTGLCAAVKGHINPNGSGFLVDDLCFPQLGKIERPLLNHDVFVAIISGLGFSRNMYSNKILRQAMNLLFDMVAGNRSDKKIASLIIAGNCLGKSARDEEKESDVDKKTPAWNKKIQSYTVDAVKLVDKFLSNVGQFTRVDVMPGALDPCNYLWPQQPMHPSLFPEAYQREAVRSVSNPHRATYCGVDFLGTSGQNVDSIRSCTAFDDSIDIMRKIMEWGHLAPTCPDLLHSYPFSSKDPLVLDTYPDVFFVGNQPEFGMGTFESPTGKKVHLISVPVFEDKRVALVFNLRNFSCEMVGLN